MPKLDLDTIPSTDATGYPPDHAGVVAGRRYRRLAPATGLTDFGVSHVTLAPGAWSAQRHWHEGEDEFVVILSGDAVLVDDAGDHPMRPGDCAAFAKNDGTAMFSRTAAIRPVRSSRSAVRARPNATIPTSTCI